MPILAFLCIRFSERDFWMFLERWYQLIHIVIAPPNPRPQVLSGEFPIHIKRSKADPLKNPEYMRPDYERKKGGSSPEIMPRLFFVTNEPGSFWNPFLADEFNVREVIARHTGPRR